MAKLPNRTSVTINPQKIAGYLLNRGHPIGGPKAKFFLGLGFVVDRPRELEDARRQHAYNCDFVKMKDNGFGINYTLRGPLICPNGQSPIVDSVWFIEASKAGQSPKADVVPVLVTAFPGPKENKS
jgi:hypothetical protein